MATIAVSDTSGTLLPASEQALPEFSVNSRRVLTLGMSLCLLGSLSFAIDLPVSQWMHTHQQLSKLHQPLQMAEIFGDSAGVILLLGTLWVLIPNRRRELLRVAVIVVLAGLSADLVKMSVSRMRPRSFANLLELQSASETFLGWFPLLSVSSKQQSFPSAHTATAVGLALALMRMFPRGWWLFPAWAAAVALQRVETGAHYVSDTCFGAAVGLLAAWACLSPNKLSRWFERFENSNHA